MIWLLKWYYGYKNFGDEVLLLWVVPYLFTNYPLDHLYIETADKNWLDTRLTRHDELLGEVSNKITLIDKHTARDYKRDELFLWWGEVLTDGRPFPYNGRNYLLRYPMTILRGSYHLLWGIGTPKKRLSARLWKFLVGKAKTVVVREKRSYEIAGRYRADGKTVLYHDFAEDVLPEVIKSLPTMPTAWSTTALLNANPYIWSNETKQELIAYAARHEHAIYFPAELGVDDTFFAELAEAIPGLTLYDRTDHSLAEICAKVAGCSGVIAARLHVLRMAKLLRLPFKPLVYQEKISTFLDACSDELS
jgi:polysaccharide pyruvyl transferase WcaK-like protein